MYIVYRTTNLLDGNIYIGVHKQKRKEFDGYLGSGKRLANALKKHGIENFKRETLFECDNREEAYWIEFLMTPYWFIKRRDVYNLREGGRGNSSRYAISLMNRPEQKERSRKQMLENNPMKHKKYRDKISKANKGKKFNISLEGSKAIADSNRRRNKPVNCYDVNGKFLKRYPSIKHANQDTKTDEWRISLACRGKVKCAGTRKLGCLYWEYAKKEKED